MREDPNVARDDAQRTRRRQIAGVTIGLGAIGFGAWGTATDTAWGLAGAALCTFGATYVLTRGVGDEERAIDEDTVRMTLLAHSGTARVVAIASLCLTVFLALPTAVAAFLAFTETGMFVIWVVAIAALGILLALNALSAAHVTLGERGLEIRRHRATRLVAYEDVAAIERDGSEVAVAMKHGSAPARLACGSPTRADAVTTRLRAALEASRSESEGEQEGSGGSAPDSAPARYDGR